MEKVLFVGGRRGLGKAVRELWQKQRPDDVLALSSRIPYKDEGLKTIVCDLSQRAQLLELLQFVRDWKPQRIFYFPGGGPWGPFGSKEWKDHQWALQVSFLSAAEMIHAAMGIPEVRQIVAVGSAIAECQPDQNAASYSASKHALRGLISTLNQEAPLKDIRLFSPGYMATDLLPHPAREGKNVLTPEALADQFLPWVLSPEASWHWFYQP